MKTMQSSKKRILYLSSITPDKSCGAHLVIWRHLVCNEDFDISVCSINALNSLSKFKFTIKSIALLEQFRKTRFSRLIANFEYLLNWFWVSSDLLEYARQYRPDIILTVPDNIHSGLAYNISKKLNIPLATNFQDLFPLSNFIPKHSEPYPIVRKFLVNKFHQLHRNSILSFYTSEGMQKWFGQHDNGHVLYPIGDFNRPDIESDSDAKLKPSGLIKLIYAGNCYGAYGRMLLKFSRQVKYSNQISLKIFPVGKGWSDDEIQEMTDAGIYQSFLPFEELRKELMSADAFLTVMSFEQAEEHFVKTSFTTKWLDYAPYGKPIFVWGPEYSSAVLFARNHGCGVVIDNYDAQSLENKILKLSQVPEEWNRYGKQARQTSDKILNPENIHSLFVEQILNILD